MRLTLRALLNWLHHNLSPEDAAVIAQKVSENEFATTLKNELEAVVKIPNLPALFVLDGTPLGNPNSAAEYLDNVMPSEMTPEFEKFCLHSEVVLAEVADCHQILSEVLNLSLEPDETMQKRLHGLYYLYYGTTETMPQDAGTDLDILSEAVLPREVPSEKPRFTRWQWGIWGGVVLVALILLMVWRPSGENQPSPAPQTAAKEKVSQTETLPEEENKEEETASLTEVAPLPEEKEVPLKETENLSQVPVTEEPEKTSEAESEKTSSEPVGESAETAAPLPELAPEPATATPEEMPEETQELEEDEEMDLWEEDEEEISAPTKIPSGGQKIGTLISPREELLWGENLYLLQSRDTIRKGQSYGSWNGFRPVLELLYQLEVTLLGNAQIRVESSQEEEGWEIWPQYGQFLFYLGEEEAGDEFHLVFSSREMSYVRLLPGARLGVDIHLIKGSDPATEPHVLIDLLLLEGAVDIYDGGETRRVDASEGPQGIYWDSSDQDAVLPTALDAIPIWVTRSFKSGIRDNAEKIQRFLKRELANGKTLKEGLQELAASDSRNSDSVRNLAEKYLAALGDSEVLRKWARTLKEGKGNELEMEYAQKSIQEVLFYSPWHAQQVKHVLDAQDYQWLWEE